MIDRAWGGRKWMADVADVNLDGVIDIGGLGINQGYPLAHKAVVHPLPKYRRGLSAICRL